MVTAELNFKNKIVMVTAAVFILACFFGYKMIYKTNLERADKLKLKIADAKKIKVLMEDTKALEEKLAEFMSIRNDNAEPGTFLSKIMDIATGCDIKTETVNTGGVVSDGPYKFLPCSMAFTSDFQTIKKFLGKLETDKKYIKIDNLTMVPHKPEEGQGKPRQKAGESVINVKIDVTGFYTE